MTVKIFLLQKGRHQSEFSIASSAEEATYFTESPMQFHDYSYDFMLSQLNLLTLENKRISFWI